MSRMNRWAAARVAVFAGALCLSGVASAQPILQQRCISDGLSAARAEVRAEWSRQCALAKVHPGDAWDTGIPASNGGSLLEYTEPTSDPFTGRDAYMGNLDNLDINTVYTNLVYRSGPTLQSVNAHGYYTWTRPASRKKPRPLYPTYGSQSDINNATQLFPHPTLATCGFYLDRNGTQPASGSFYVNGYCEADSASLSSGLPLTLSGNAGSTMVYSLEVPAGATHVVFETSGGTGDVDLYVRSGAAPTLTQYDCRPFLGGSAEGCNMRSPAPGTWYVMVHGYSAYSGVTLKGTVNLLYNGYTTSSLSGEPGSEQRWTVDVPANTSRLSVFLTGAADTVGDADLYVRYGAAPDLSTYDCRPYTGGNTEQCHVTHPAAGVWHVMVRGFTAYSRATLSSAVLVNLARGKPTSQSSVAANGFPERAVDGNTDGSYPSNSTTHTDESFQPWWQVDLQDIKQLDSVVLHNRTDCCWNRLTHFKLKVSANGIDWREYNHPGEAAQQTQIAASGAARYVRVQLNGTGILSLAEVQVLGSP